ncbi:hypothetical protein RMCBS344292_12707 [Rhizopus microsporus]|uniref:Uncharacterized protein n=1 Tax=Rhizopus microsporus TaxID=58291 RepID=A0A0A1P120_RHIZD|nr:hypothetical protein BCV71DRAFT_229116 [Rhizopus microsporus]CEI98602.1 hypothetical protein RMCBS344292_12707 [Rhizopus microsporus]
MVDPYYDTFLRLSWRPMKYSFDSCSTDEGYHTDERPYTDKEAHSNEPEIPILKSNHTLKISYSKLTYTLTLSIIILSIYTIFRQPFPWRQTFPPIFILFHLIFHLTHLTAHIFNWLNIEKHCVVYGTWLYCTGWLLGKFLFSERLAASDFSNPTSLLFWLLMLERRNAWGIIVWEFVSRLDQNLYSTQHLDTHRPLRLWELGSVRLLAFRIWCLLGTGSFWGLVYIGLAYMDGFPFKYLLQFHHVLKLLWISTIGGLIMIIFWSFWTFQYKGVLWQKELRKGIIVWYSEGVAHAAQVL